MNNSLTPVIRRYVRYLRLERNFSPHTIEAYRNDLSHLETFMERESLALADVRLDHLRGPVVDENLRLHLRFRKFLSAKILQKSETTK